MYSDVATQRSDVATQSCEKISMSYALVAMHGGIDELFSFSF